MMRRSWAVLTGILAELKVRGVKIEPYIVLLLTAFFNRRLAGTPEIAVLICKIRN